MIKKITQKRSRKILALLPILLGSQGAAHAAGAQLYGAVDTFLGSSKASGDPKSVLGVQSGGMTTSFWGFAGSEDLGNNLTVNFRIESYFLADTGAGGRAAGDALFARNAYVGLESKVGEIRAGRLANPMFLATALFDPFGGSTKFSPLLNVLWTPSYGRYFAADTGWSNAVGYYTPEINGLSGRFVYGLGEVAGTNSSNNAVAMLLYDKAPWGATFAIQRTRAGAGFLAKSWAQTALAAAVSYDFNFLKAYVQYDSTRNSGDSIKTDTVQVGMTVPYGNGKFMASAVQTVIKADGVATIRRSDLGFGYDYFLSKRSDLYANVLYDKLSRQGSGTAFGVGIRHKF